MTIAHIRILIRNLLRAFGAGGHGPRTQPCLSPHLCRDIGFSEDDVERRHPSDLNRR